MVRNRIVLLVLLLVAAFASCNKMPEHAKYIPQNAMIVAGLNTKELSKKLAWDVLMGSKLLDEMKAKSPKNTEAAEGLGDAGIDALNTTFFYFTPSTSEDGYSYLTVVVPLTDSKKWENYIRKNFNSAVVKEVSKRKEALLEDDLYASWNDNMAIVRKATISTKNQQQTLDYSPEDDSAFAAPAPVMAVKPDPGKLSADMATAFTIQKDNDITADKRFSKLQTEGHDVTFWMNYEVFMKNMNTQSGNFMGGLALGNNLWKDAGYSAGIDLDKGKINADIKYYLSKDLKEVYSKIGNKNADKEMLDRLPGQNINMIASMNISPDGTKALLEKMGVLGFMSLALVQSDLTADDIFQSFTGDMAMSLSNFSVQAQADSSGEASYGRNMKTDMDFVFVLKINDKVRFNKLLNYVKTQNGLTPVDATTYNLAGNQDIVVSIDKGFVVIADNSTSAKSYLNGDHTSQAKPEIIKKEVYGHPMGIFIDIQSLLNGVAGDGKQGADKEILELSKNVFQNVFINGGENKKDLFAFSGTLNLVNKDENSLLQLLDFSYKINEIRKKYDNAAKQNEAPLAAGRDTTVLN